MTLKTSKKKKFFLGDIKKKWHNDITIHRSQGSCDVRSHTVSVVTKGDCRSEIFNWLKAQQLESFGKENAYSLERETTGRRGTY